ncbi:hypothetical protein M514_06042 [Trichuris suis]|uniref:Uncharacterized protein n=1 Tax=Trichuris suis TaxID=68888 RepID=A0A085M7D2_9BILA|nr:hypothetical protein M513_06042 [Trichuris suis]KFD70726.1 hypothetical protein M514_06042 [Trichuris suis]
MTASAAVFFTLNAKMSTIPSRGSVGENVAGWKNDMQPPNDLDGQSACALKASLDNIEIIHCHFWSSMEYV